MNKIMILLSSCLVFFMLSATAQESRRAKKAAAKRERNAKIAALTKQAEEGATVFNKQGIIGISAQIDGYGLFYELAKLKTARVATIYHFGLSNRTHRKEERISSYSEAGPFVVQNNPFVFGKINNFYQASFLYGRQYLMGSKANKNGIDVYAVVKGGLVLGFLRPYYVQANFTNNLNVFNDVRNIAYNKTDDLGKNYLLDPNRVLAGTGSKYGWNEMKVNPGLKVHGALRFDFGRQPDRVSAAEIFLTSEFYASKVEQMIYSTRNRFFFSAGLAFDFGRRK
jgi:hypothetical protein